MIETETPAASARHARIVATADQCVMCGLCLPHCPTYRVKREEAQSPRGRLALAKAFASGALEPDARWQQALDDCLACAVCETVCPVPVAYDRAIVDVRAARPPRDRHSTGAAALRRLLREPRVLGAALALARVLRAIGGRALLAMLPREWRSLARSAPARRRERAPVAFTAAEGERRGAVALFRGCAARVVDRDTQLSTVEVVSRLGYDAHAPQAVHCCGALAAHEGDPAEAARLEQASGELFAALPIEAVIGTASGCQRALDQRVLGAVGLPGREVFAWLADGEKLAGRRLRIKPRRAALHEPCTHASAASRATQQALARIEGLTLLPLPLQPRCCGAAGSYFVAHGAIAEPLRDERIAQIRELAPDVVLTSNVGCRSWLEAGLREAGLDIPVCHPITILAEALEP